MCCGFQELGQFMPVIDSEHPEGWLGSCFVYLLGRCSSSLTVNILSSLSLIVCLHKSKSGEKDFCFYFPQFPELEGRSCPFSLFKKWKQVDNDWKDHTWLFLILALGTVEPTTAIPGGFRTTSQPPPRESTYRRQKDGQGIRKRARRESWREGGKDGVRNDKTFLGVKDRWKLFPLN